MGMMLPVSFKQSERSLWDWIFEHKNEFSVSDICKRALMEKKAEWDAIHTENPALLHKKIDNLKQTIGMQASFIAADKARQEDWFNFFEKNGNNNLKQKQKGGITEIIESEKVGGIAQ